MRRDFAYLPLLAVLAAGCGRCGARPRAQAGPSLEELLPRVPRAVARVSSVSSLARHARELARAVARFPEGEMAGAALDAVTAQLGFDPRDDRALAQAGVDGARPAAMVFEGAEPWMAVPVADRGRFEATAARLAASRLGAEKRERRGEVILFSSAGGPAAALAFAGGYGLVATGAGAADEVARALGRPQEQRLSDEPLFRRAVQKLEPGAPGWDVEWYAPADSPYAPPASVPGRAFAAGLSFRNLRLAVRAVAMLSVAEGTALSGLALPAGDTLVGRLPAGDPLFVRLGGNPELLGFVWDSQAPALLREALAKAKIDVPHELLGNLQPGIALGLGLAPHLDLSSAPSLDPRRENPFRYLTLEALGKVRDAKAAAATLGKLRALPSGLGFTITNRRVAGTDVTTFQYELGEGPSIALAGSTVVVTGGEGEMDAALSLLGGKAAGYLPPPWMRRALLGRVSDGAVLDVETLRRAVEAIPASAYGGLTGLTLHSLANRLLAPLVWVGPVTATADVDADAVVIDVDLIFRS